MKALWHDRYREWSPQGLGDTDLVLTKVQIEEVACGCRPTASGLDFRIGLAR